MPASMPQSAPLFSSPDAAAIVGQIDRDGYAAIGDFVSPEDLATAQDFVRREVANNGGNYLDFK